MKRVIPGVIAALAICAAVAAQQTATAPPPAPAPAPPPVATAPGKYVGVASCVSSGCHGSTQPLAATAALQNEYYTWLNSDRHAQAYNVLFSDRSARIAKNMRLRKKAYEENVCLDCHTTNVTASMVDGNVDSEDGVQCEACHGPASGWRSEHVSQGWTHEQSVARGMTDLRKVPARAQLCAGCHTGNEKKEVDHELIASGHPILQFELDNYTESMPPHWTPNRESHGLQAWAVGQVVKFRQSLDNVARHARGDEWPEFADMSCYNCHHSLQGSVWRQERGYPDRAGLPAWSPQHWATLRVLINRAAPGARAELDPIVQQLGVQVSRMNNPASVADLATRASKIITGITPRVDSARWNESDIRSLMTTLADDRDFILRSDVHAAEQTAFALQSLSSALTRRNKALLRSPMTRSIDALFDELQNRDGYEPSRFVQKMQAVRATL